MSTLGFLPTLATISLISVLENDLSGYVFLSHRLPRKWGFICSLWKIPPPISSSVTYQWKLLKLFWYMTYVTTFFLYVTTLEDLIIHLRSSIWKCLLLTRECSERKRIFKWFGLGQLEMEGRTLKVECIVFLHLNFDDLN